jgi:hypothetical protein
MRPVLGKEMSLIFGAAGFAEIPEEGLRYFELQMFALSLIPVVVYILVAALNWFLFARRRNWSKVVLMTLPVIVWLIYGTMWPSWWIYSQ